MLVGAIVGGEAHLTGDRLFTFVERADP